MNLKLIRIDSMSIINQLVEGKLSLMPIFHDVIFENVGVNGVFQTNVFNHPKQIQKKLKRYLTL